jgi:multiple sugar transport system permease protein
MEGRLFPSSYQKLKHGGGFLLKKRRLDSVKAYVFLSPFLFFFAFMVLYPIIKGFDLSLKGQRGARMWYVGFDNYARVLTDPKFWESFKIPAYLLLVQVPLMIFCAILIALLLEKVEGRKGATFFRLVYYIPSTIPAIVAAIIWGYMFSDSMSPFLPILNLVGFSGKLLTREIVPLVMLIIILWQLTGYTAILIYSSLLSIPKEYTEAATLDGAGYWQIAFRIKVPIIKDMLITLFIFNAIGALQVFNEPWMLGGLVVLPTNYTPAMYIYNSAFAHGRFTYAAAMGLILAAITFLISFYFLKSATKEMFTE